MGIQQILLRFDKPHISNLTTIIRITWACSPVILIAIDRPDNQQQTLDLLLIFNLTQWIGGDGTH